MWPALRADFPMFEWDEEQQRLAAMHHPFTAPDQADLGAGNGAGLRNARALAYDLVYNGVEIAGVPWPQHTLPMPCAPSLAPAQICVSSICVDLHAIS